MEQNKEQSVPHLPERTRRANPVSAVNGKFILLKPKLKTNQTGQRYQILCGKLSPLDIIQIMMF